MRDGGVKGEWMNGLGGKMKTSLGLCFAFPSNGGTRDVPTMQKHANQTYVLQYLRCETEPNARENQEIARQRACNTRR